MERTDFINQRKTWSGKAIISHRKQYQEHYGFWGVFLFAFDLFRVLKKPFYKLSIHIKWKWLEISTMLKRIWIPVGIKKYANWIDYLKTTKTDFTAYTEQPFVRKETDPKIYAFYLTQYHSIPENDFAHGKGFTEWTNVAAATPQFVGHYQPKIPYDLGFYNLLMPGVMERQAEIARTYGVYGFCFYYYWFSGRKLLEKPLEYFLHSNIDLHYHLCWATENWSKKWDGGENELIVEQRLSVDDAENFFADLLPYISDSRYECINGKPLLVVYRVNIFEKDVFKAFIDRLNSLAIDHGFNGLHILCTNAFSFYNPNEYGCSGLVEFPPHGITHELYQVGRRRLSPRTNFKIINMSAYLKDKQHLHPYNFPVFKTCFPNWDNTPRKLYTQGYSYLLEEKDFQLWLKDNILWTRSHHGSEEQLVYINAWNEWGEGAMLEPTTRFGYKHLASVKHVLESTRNLPSK